MARMKQQAQAQGQSQGRSGGGGGPAARGVSRLRREIGARLHASRVEDLGRRVAELEQEVQECRKLNLRLAELTDVVEELLLPVAQRDEEKVAELLRRYDEGL